MSAPRHVAEEEETVLAPGNPMRLRALLPLFGGLLIAVVTMAAPVSATTMLLVGGGAACVATWATLDLLGTFDDGSEAEGVAFTQIGAPLAVALGSLLLLWLALRAAVAGTLAPLWAAFAIPAAMIAGLASSFRVFERLGPWRHDDEGSARPLHRRHGFWLLSLAIALHVPLLGSHSLVDPWESHYGEVSREILARADWISLWWADDGWFQSKPILTFWLQAASMSLLGVQYEPGQMLAAIEQGAMPHPEWALRFPSMMAMLAGLYVLYRGVAKTCGRRAGFLGGVVLITMPQFFLVARQAMTDMPFVAAMMACLGFVLLAADSAPERVTPVHLVRLGPIELRLTLFHAVFGAGLVLVMLQGCYLASRNLLIATEPYFDVRFVGDVFASGSPGNCGTPGNAACAQGLLPTQDRLQPAVQAFIWLQATALLLWLSWGERRIKRLLYLAAWLCAALATMAKGIGGLALPMTAVFLWVVATGRWRELSRMEIVAGLLFFAVTALPWFAASYVRHGRVFLDRLFFDHMVKRTFGEMHHTNKGVDQSFRYYVWQLGYATFPWCGLAPIGLVSWLRHRDGGGEPARARWSTACLLAANVLVGFALFTLMGTKFHHYCLPLLPALAMLCGIMLDDMLRPATHDFAWGGVAIGAALATVAVGADLAWSGTGRQSAVRFMSLFTYKYTRPWPDEVVLDGALWTFTALSALVIGALAWQRRRSWVLVALGTVAAMFALWVSNVAMMHAAPHWGQRELLVRYEQEQAEHAGPVVAYQMNWKGENFYRGNAVPAFKVTGAAFQSYVDDERRHGRRTLYFLTEHKRIKALHAELGRPRGFEQLTDKALNNKFALLRVRY